MVIVHREIIYEKYSSYGDWCTCLVWLIFWALTLVVTFLCCYYSGNMWQEIEFYTEQPDVKYTGEVIFSYETQAGGKKIWTSNKQANNLIPAALKFEPEFRSTFVKDLGWRKLWDYSNNLRTPSPTGKVDDFRFSVSFAEAGIVSKVEMLLFFRHMINEKNDMTFESVMYTSAIAPCCYSNSRIYSENDLVLVQRVPFFRFHTKDSFNWRPFYLWNATSYDDLGFEKILKNFKEERRDYVLRRENLHDVWTKGRLGNDIFTFESSFNIRNQVFVYYTWIWQLLKGAWVQYIAVFIVIGTFFYYMKRYLIINDYLNTKRFINYDLFKDVLDRKYLKKKFL